MSTNLADFTLRADVQNTDYVVGYRSAISGGESRTLVSVLKTAFWNSPTLVTPALGTPTALVGTNITGTGPGFTAGNVITNANLTGPITSTGNATSVAAQTGTGTTFVMATSPTLVTPVLGVATVTTINGLTPTAQAVGFTLAGGATSKTLTIPLDASVSGTHTGTSSGSNTGDQTITLTGDVTGSGTGSFATAIGTGVIGDSQISASAGIVDTKLGTIATALKVSNSATTAASANTLSAIVARDASGNFSAGTITANLTGNVSGSSGSTTGNAATATALATGRTIAITGDLTYTSSSFDGTANVTAAGTLASVASAGTSGGSTAIPVVTINAKGLTTSITTAVVIAPAGTLTGATLASGVTASSLTSLGTIANLTATAGTISTTPSASTDIANKIYVDTVAQGLDAKASCVAATTADITLSGAQTIDGISIVVGNRVLVKNQTLSQNNGIYLCAAGAWPRTTDADTWDELTSAFAFIETGTVNADCGFVCTANAGGTLGTTALPWSQFSNAGSFTASTGLTLAGTVFSLTAPVTVALGGTNSTSPGIAAFNNISGFTASGATGTTSTNLVFSTSPTLVTPALGTPSALVGTNITGTAAGLTAGNVTTNANLTGGVTSVGNAATVVTNANLTGDVTSVGNATTLTNAPVIAKVLTGYTSGAGTVAATDSILQAIQKLNGNDATNADLTGVITSVGNATSIASQTGTGTTFVVSTSPTITTPVIAQINDASGNETLKLASIASAVNEVTIENAATGNAVHISATGGDASVGLHLAGKGASGYVNVQDSTDATKRIMFNAAGGTTNTRTMLSSTQTVDRTISLPDATDTLVGKATTDTLTNKSISLGSNTLTATSAQLATAVSDETGSGSLVFATSPTLVTPALGTPSALVGTNITGTAAGLTAGNVTTNANLTGVITSVGNATSIASQTGTGTKFVVDTSPVLVTPVLGVATATSINGNTLTTGTYTLTGAAAKTLTFSNSLTLAGTDATTLTFPTTSATIARTDAAQTFTGIQTIAGTSTLKFGATAAATIGVSADTTAGVLTITAPSSGRVSISSATDASAIGTAGTVLTGGLSVAKKLVIGDTLTGTSATFSGSVSDSIGTMRQIPQNSQSTAYTAVLADAGKHLLHPSADTTARTFTIPANSSVAYVTGTAITFVNQASAGVMTISITTDTMRLAGAGTTGSRTLAANGIATALKITSTEWIISGTGLT